MAEFIYRGRNLRGEMVSGRMDGPDMATVADQLYSSGLIPIEIAPAVRLPGLGLQGLFQFGKDRVSTVDLILLFRQLYTLSRAGVPILRALAGLQESASSRGLSRVIEDMRISLDSGRELSAAMAKHPHVFEPFHLNMVRVGEATGRLEEIFLRISEHLDFEHEMSKRVKAALRYPTFVIIAMVVAITVANVFIIPTFAKMYEGMGSDLPFLTKFLIAFSNFTVAYWWMILAGGAGAFYLFRSWIRTSAGAWTWDRIKLDLPLAGPILKKVALARFTRSASLAIRSGVPLVVTLDTVAAVVGNVFIAQKVRDMSRGVQRGESVLGSAAATGAFSPMVLQMIAVGDETGALDELLLQVAHMYEREIEYEVKGLAAQIEPIIILMLAAFVAILALGILSPMWNMHKAIIKS